MRSSPVKAVTNRFFTQKVMTLGPRKSRIFDCFLNVFVFLKNYSPESEILLSMKRERALCVSTHVQFSSHKKVMGFRKNNVLIS